MDADPSPAALLEAETTRLCGRCLDALDGEDEPFEAAKTIVPRLGAHWRDDHAEFGFWTPQLLEAGVPPTGRSFITAGGAHRTGARTCCSSPTWKASLRR
ncbi:hypothetical protein AArcSl_1409 [Halalkaliarchaeum desulfuricum]|uniref:Uncharacterized protein n=1 Tax=Halalkaliarchaeum desulfuricum TaxID=2055893 RepID=A0A343TIW8_9EURY|nr:hypothetical protein [Halalkaliarchaeum desulfuricum]AUX09040.1 hypothetical protein AArcSl_1409 [Halalkaliarchaeum desulfuricum]